MSEPKFAVGDEVVHVPDYGHVTEGILKGTAAGFYEDVIPAP